MHSPSSRFGFRFTPLHTRAVLKPQGTPATWFRAFTVLPFLVSERSGSRRSQAEGPGIVHPQTKGPSRGVRAGHAPIWAPASG